MLNATGVIVHTNLGRAPLAAAALDAVPEAAAGYSTLEYDVAAGARGSRQAHVEGLLRELTGAEAAIAVNNCASAVLLAAAALAGGRELVVSRGQLVEIGGSFRIPDVVAQSGARLVEVGTTNRTRLADYERAFGPRHGAVMRAHQSNFRTVGFVEEVEIEELCAAAGARGRAGDRRRGLGRAGRAAAGAGRRAAGAALGGGGLRGHVLLRRQAARRAAGGADGRARAEAIERCRSHPLARAVRIDKLSLAALEATLRLYLDPAARCARSRCCGCSPPARRSCAAAPSDDERSRWATPPA